jgi:hypothetical protein
MHSEERVFVETWFVYLAAVAGKSETASIGRFQYEAMRLQMDQVRRTIGANFEFQLRIGVDQGTLATAVLFQHWRASNSRADY